MSGSPSVQQPLIPANVRSEIPSVTPLPEDRPVTMADLHRTAGDAIDALNTCVARYDSLVGICTLNEPLPVLK